MLGRNRKNDYVTFGRTMGAIDSRSGRFLGVFHSEPFDSEQDGLNFYLEMLPKLPARDAIRGRLLELLSAYRAMRDVPGVKWDLLLSDPMPEAILAARDEIQRAESAVTLVQRNQLEPAEENLRVAKEAFKAARLAMDRAEKDLAQRREHLAELEAAHFGAPEPAA